MLLESQRKIEEAGARAMNLTERKHFRFHFKTRGYQNFGKGIFSARDPLESGYVRLERERRIGIRSFSNFGGGRCALPVPFEMVFVAQGTPDSITSGHMSYSKPVAL